MKINVPTKKIRKVRDHWHYTGKNKVYHFVKKELATVLIEVEVTRIDKNGENITKYISYILQFIESAGFMATSLSKFVNNLSEEIHKI